jgi:hypothetical protein
MTSVTASQENEERRARPSGPIARVGFDISRDGKQMLMVQEVKTDEQRAASLAGRAGWA